MGLLLLLGALIAYRQWRTAQNRLKFDLFDRRLVIYTQTRDFVAYLWSVRRVRKSKIYQFQLATQQARWLFNPKLATYLEEIEERAWRLESLQRQLEPFTGDRATAPRWEIWLHEDPGARERHLADQHELRDWFAGQAEALDGRFAPFLSIAH